MAKIVLYDFYADWCGPCQMQTPIIHELEKKFKGKVTFKKANVDTEGALAQKYKVSSIPALVIEVDGKEVKRFVGFTDAKTLEKALSSL